MPSGYRGGLGTELRFTGLGSFAIRSADEPVVALHHGGGEEHLPLDGADRETCRDALFEEFRATLKPRAATVAPERKVEEVPGVRRAG